MEEDKFNYVDKAVLNFLYSSGSEVKDNTMTEKEFYALPINDLYVKNKLEKKQLLKEYENYKHYLSVSNFEEVILTYDEWLIYTYKDITLSKFDYKIGANLLEENIKTGKELKKKQETGEERCERIISKINSMKKQITIITEENKLLKLKSNNLLEENIKSKSN